jgi:peptide/nickel transport system permease protein/nickel transport system permease protein
MYSPTFLARFSAASCFLPVKLQVFKVLPGTRNQRLYFTFLCSRTAYCLRNDTAVSLQLLSELSSDYVRYARARGLSARRILTRHVMRNALPPIITLFCQYLGYLIAGKRSWVESVFSIKGIGSI